MNRARMAEIAGWIAGLGICFLLNFPGYRLAASHPGAAWMWPWAGIAAAAVALFGNRAGFVALAGNLLAGWAAGLAIPRALFLGGVTTAEGWAAAWWLQSCGGPVALRHGGSFLRFAAGVVGVTATGALVREGAAVSGDELPWAMLGEAWEMRMLGDGLGVILLTALVLAWSPPAWPPLRGTRALELGLALILLGVAAIAPDAHLGLSGTFLAVPVIFWIAFRWRGPVLTVALVLLAVLAVSGQEGREVFPGKTGNESLFALQAFLTIVSIVGLGLVALLEERDEHVAKLHAFNEELETKIAARTRELERINQELTDAVSIVAHDVRGPVAGIRTLARHMRWASLDLSAKEGHELLGEIERTSSDAVEMMSRLLELQHANARRPGLVPAEIGRLVADVCRHYENAAAEKEITLRVIRPERGVTRLMDAESLKFIVSNLVSNALKFLSAGGTVEVRVGGSFSGCILSVTDDGPGIPAADLPAIFNRFGRAGNRPTGSETSSGLGLFIVRKFVLALGGTLYCESAPGEGATFVVEWPAEDPAGILQE